MKYSHLFLFLIIVSCNNSSKVLSPEAPSNNYVTSINPIKSSNPIDLIKSLHEAEINVAKLTPNEATSSFILKYQEEYINTINISKELDVSEFMINDSLKAKVVLYSFSLGVIPFKDDLILIEDERGNLKYKTNYYLSSYSKNPKIKAIAAIIENWSDNSSVYDYYGIDNE